MNTPLTVNQRLGLVRSEAGLTREAFAGRIGATPNHVYMMESGRRTPSPAMLKQICRVFDVREEWLRDGAGEMHRDLSPALEAGERVRRLLVDRPKTTAAAVISALVDLDPDGPEWASIGSLLRRIKSKIAPEE